MELLVLDESFNAVGIIDTFSSLLWTERYSSCGDFELTAPASTKLLMYLQQDYYLWMKESDSVMIIEQIEIKCDLEDGDKLIVSGRSLESILERRIVWNQTNLNGSLQDCIFSILNGNLINPSMSERRINNFKLVVSDNPKILDLKLEAQYSGENLYEIISTICESENIGFKVILSDTNEFLFGLYAGEDRSYDQIENPYVVFSPAFDNIISSNYLESKKPYKTVVLVAGEGEGVNRKTAICYASNVTGLERRELYTDAGEVSSQVDGRTLSNSEYLNMLVQKGRETLSENTVVQSVEGEMETSKIFVYGQDFQCGDIVQLVNPYGYEAKSRVTEVVRSQDTNGINVYPTFKMVEKEVNNI